MVGGHGGRNARDGDAECREGELADGHPGSAAASQRGRLGGAGAGAPRWPRLLWARLQRSRSSLCDTSTFSLLAFAVTQWECACNECVGIYDALRDLMSNPGIRHNAKFACRACCPSAPSTLQGTRADIWQGNVNQPMNFHMQVGGELGLWLSRSSTTISMWGTTLMLCASRCSAPTSSIPMW